MAGAGARTFDGVFQRDGRSGAVPGGFDLKRELIIRLSLSPLGDAIPGAVYESLGVPQPPRPKTSYDPDEFGGPQPQGFQGTWRERLLPQAEYGLKWGLSLAGLSGIIHLGLGQVFASFPWVLHASQGFLEWAGRSELLIRLGSTGIASAVSSSPASFFLSFLPGAILQEELAFRFVAFGGVFLLLAAARPISRWAEDRLSALPNLYGIREAARTALHEAGRLSSAAFPLAAAYSSFRFAVAHVGAWGFDPALFAFHFAAGIALAFSAYKSRGMLAPAVAHLAYDAASISAFYWLPSLLPAAFASAPAIVLNAVGAAFLLHQWISYRRAKSGARAEALGKPKPAGPDGFWRRMCTAALLVPLAMVSLGAGLSDLPAPRQEPPAAVLSLSHKDIGDLYAPRAHAPAQEAVRPAPPTTAEMVQSVKPAVVMIRSGGSLGSGFIVSKDGLVVTNAHVVGEAGQGGAVLVVFNGGFQVQARVVAFHAGRDLALLQLPVKKGMSVPFLPLAKAGPREGDEVVALGYPYGLPFSVSRGVVSGIDGRGTPFLEHLQHDASVNPGNSGGPLLNPYGEVEGVNSSIMSAGGGFDGISFAISLEDLRAALQQYQRIGNIDTAYLGIIFHPASRSAQGFGAFVEEVRPGAPAALAGIKAGDILVSVDGRSLIDPSEAVENLGQYLARKTPESRLSIQVVRGGELKTIEVRLAADPGKP
jgi:S1-C subfamily serine protease/membrane protease YdiL (CAAX protease family)